MMMNAILWLARSGAAWADIPERYGSYKTVYSRFANGEMTVHFFVF